MSGATEGRRPGQSVLSRRQLLGWGLAGTAGLVAAGCSTSGLDGAGAADGPGPPGRLTVDGLVHPLGVDPADVWFAWTVGDARRGASQSAHRIVVTGPRVGTGAGPVVWDSGQVTSGEQAFVRYGGPELATDAAYRWTVQTWDGAGRPGPTSAPAAFETSLGPGDWTARWIRRTADPVAEPDQYTYARTEYTLRSGAVTRARVSVSADQQYELYVNGVRAGKGQAYSYPDTTYFETLDVTGLLRPGAANALAVVTNWQGPTKGHPAGQPGLLVQLAVHGPDGSVHRVATDGAWRVTKGAWLPGTQRNLEGDLVDHTEIIDGPGVPQGWLLPGFDDSGWSPPTVLGRGPSEPWTRLVPVRTRIVEVPVPPVSITTLASGSVVADFGAVVAAVPTVRFHQGVAGRTVAMRAGYLLDEPTTGQPFTGVPGQVSVAHGTQHTDMSYGYVQRGGTEEFHPFDYLGFRYFQVDGAGEALGSADITALARHTALPDVPPATFTSDQPVVDAVFRLGMHSAVFTAQEQFIDTPTREKGPWLFDGFNESCTAMAAVGEQNLTRKSLLEFAQSQGRYWPNGAVNKIYPTGLGALDINEFTEIYPEWVWQYWLHTGDAGLLAAVYDVLVRLADYVRHAVSPTTGLVTSLPATNVYYDFPVVTRLNVLGVNVFQRVADVAAALGRPAAEVALQRRRRDRLAAAVNRLLTRPDGTFVDGLAADGTPQMTVSQTANACAVAYGVVPARNLAAVAGLVASSGMEAPPNTAAEVLRTLDVAGRHADLVALLTDATGDGWANIVARGATFTWEVWNPSDANGDSMSHGWGSNVLVEIERALLGVRPTGPGFATFAVTPPTGGLGRAAGTVPTPRGTVSVSWVRNPGGGPFQLDVEVPPNSVAEVTVPAGRPEDVTEGGRPVERAAGVRRIGVDDGAVRIEIGSGSYRFESRSPS